MKNVLLTAYLFLLFHQSSSQLTYGNRLPTHIATYGNRFPQQYHQSHHQPYGSTLNYPGYSPYIYNNNGYGFTPAAGYGTPYQNGYQQSYPQIPAYQNVYAPNYQTYGQIPGQGGYYNRPGYQLGQYPNRFPVGNYQGSYPQNVGYTIPPGWARPQGDNGYTGVLAGATDEDFIRNNFNSFPGLLSQG